MDVLLFVLSLLVLISNIILGISLIVRLKKVNKLQSELSSILYNQRLLLQENLRWYKDLINVMRKDTF